MVVQALQSRRQLHQLRAIVNWQRFECSIFSVSDWGGSGARSRFVFCIWQPTGVCVCAWFLTFHVQERTHTFSSFGCSAFKLTHEIIKRISRIPCRFVKGKTMLKICSVQLLVHQKLFSIFIEMGEDRTRIERGEMSESAARTRSVRAINKTKRKIKRKSLCRQSVCAREQNLSEKRKQINTLYWNDFFSFSPP